MGILCSDNSVDYWNEPYLLNHPCGAIFNKTVLSTPGLLKFFGRVGYRHPRKVCERFPRIMATLLEIVEDDRDANLQNIAVETVGYIGHTVEGKHALIKHSECGASLLGLVCR